MNKNELDIILKEGEGYKIEFKENISGIDKEIVALQILLVVKFLLG
jgi:ATP-dependent DNA helicase RecG